MLLHCSHPNKFKQYNLLTKTKFPNPKKSPA